MTQRHGITVTIEEGEVTIVMSVRQAQGLNQFITGAVRFMSLPGGISTHGVGKTTAGTLRDALKGAGLAYGPRNPRHDKRAKRTLGTQESSLGKVFTDDEIALYERSRNDV